MKPDPRLSGRRLTSIANDQRGLVSTYVSMGIISVLGVVSIAFASVMQTEYGQARDRQLGTQARYAAEAAINDARQVVHLEIHQRLGTATLDDDLLQRPYDTLTVDEWYGCDGGSGTNTASGFEGDFGSGIEYTCVEVDGRPIKLVYDDISTDRSKNVLLQTRRIDDTVFYRSNVHRLVINWQGPSPSPLGTTYQTAAVHGQELYSQNLWPHYVPMLKIQIIPLNLRDGWRAVDLDERTRTYFLYPTAYHSVGTIDPHAKIRAYGNNPTEDGLIINADCDGGPVLACAVEIIDLLTPSGSSYEINDEPGRSTDVDGIIYKKSPTVANSLDPEPTVASVVHDEMAYILLIRSIYTPAKVELSAFNRSNDELRFVNQQINITATGRAGGLTHRLREVIPVLPKYNRPEYAIDSAEHVCKVLIGEPTTGISFDHSAVLAYNNPNLGLADDIKAFCATLHP